MKTLRPLTHKLDPWQDPNVEPYISIEGLSKNYGGIKAVNELNLNIYRGEFFSLLGGSGCGKSTLLRMLAGFEQPTSGQIFIDGMDMSTIPPHHRPVNMMFQSYALFPHMNVAHNIAFGLKQEGKPKSEIKELVAWAMELVQMENLGSRMPHQLSGGQKQRVALARSLVKKPKLLLLDEPLGALDRKLREKTQFELVTIQEKVGITFIMVTHDQEEAMTMSTRVAVMHEGQIRQVGAPTEIYEFPNSRHVAQFIGSMNMFEGIVVEETDGAITVQCDDIETALLVNHGASMPVGAHVTVAVRPEKVMISKVLPKNIKHNYVLGEVIDIAYLGDVSIYHVRIDSGITLLAQISNAIRMSELPVMWEDQVYLYWKAENGVVLSA